jgi:hypothetical protein
MGGCLYKGQREATGILTQFFIWGQFKYKVSKFQAAVEHNDASSCTLYYAFFVLLLAPAVLGSAN